MKLGIVGLPNVGKSTLFNAITQAGVLAANYPFATIEPNIGMVEVPDPRLAVLSELSHSKRIVPAVVEFYDIAGLVRGASQGEGLGNKFLADIRQCEAIVQVLRCFEDPNVSHVDGSIDPLRDIETINLELILSDMELVEKILAKTEKIAKSDKAARPEAALLHRILDVLNEGKSARVLDLNEEEAKLLRSYQLLSTKPILYIANVSDAEVAGTDVGTGTNPWVPKIRAFADTENARVVALCAQAEAEIAELDATDKEEFLQLLGLSSSGVDRLIRASYDLLGQISFLTTGEMETRAWTIQRDTPAVEAAGKIHTDIQRGFIRAEIVSYEDLVVCGSMNVAREKGLVRLEGKDYPMQDGDVVYFRFNV